MIKSSAFKFDGLVKSQFCSLREHVGRPREVHQNAKTRANALKQLAFFDDKLLLGLCPKMLNVALKRLFTSLS